MSASKPPACQTTAWPCTMESSASAVIISPIATLADNGMGLNLSGTALRCYVAGNKAYGVAGGTIRSSVVLNQAGYGIIMADLVENSAVREKQRHGNRGKKRKNPYTSVMGSMIIDKRRHGRDQCWGQFTDAFYMAMGVLPVMTTRKPVGVRSCLKPI